MQVFFVMIADVRSFHNELPASWCGSGCGLLASGTVVVTHKVHKICEYVATFRKL